MVFKDYANFYDALYQDKDYQQECQFVKGILDRYGTGETKTILDLGCGTGSHALILAAMGYTVTGVDLSAEMLSLASNKARKQKQRIRFLEGDIRRLDLGQRFDAVLAMFNVLGYQTTNEDIESALRSVRRHLAPGGIFIGDLWFGPAVLREKPAERTKTIEQGKNKIVRHARPVLDVIRQTVEVNYTVSEAGDGRHTSKVKEPHLVRFFFYQELLGFLERNGISVVKIGPFMYIDAPLDEQCWNISVIGRGA